MFTNRIVNYFCKTLCFLTLVSFGTALLAVESAPAPAPVVSVVPANFDGNVGSAPLASDGTIDILAGHTYGLRGGSFDRTYNGISGKILEGEPLGEAALNELNFKLAAHLYGITELGKKFCKPTGEDYPASIAWWYFPARHYLVAEKVRAALMAERIQIVQDKMAAMTSADNSNSQLEGIKLQIESLNALIDGISGSSMFSLDTRASEVRATSRIAWREKLLTSLVLAVEKDHEEEVKLLTAARECTDGVDKSASIASAACARKKTVRSCDDQNVCTSTEVPDPVPGSCDVASIHLPLIRKGAFEDLAKLYNVAKIPSQELNEKYSRLLDTIISNVASMPISSESATYDWTSPLSKCLENTLGKPIRNNGMACAAIRSNSDAENNYSDIAFSNDPLLKLARETTGLLLNVAEYEFLKKTYTEVLGTGKSKDEAFLQVREILLKSPFGKSYLTGAPIDQVAQNEYRLAMEKFARDNGYTTNKCTKDTCNSFPGVEVSEPNFNLASPAIITEEVNSFLVAIGVPANLMSEASSFFIDSWGKDDLTIGHSKQRLEYFEVIKAKMIQLLEDDKKRLGKAIIQRDQLVKYYNDVKDIYSGKSAKKIAGSGVAGSNSPSANITNSNQDMINTQGTNGMSSGSTSLAQNSDTPLLNASNSRLESFGGINTSLNQGQSQGNAFSNSLNVSSSSFAVASKAAIEASSKKITKLISDNKRLLASNNMLKPDLYVKQTSRVNSKKKEIQASSSRLGEIGQFVEPSKIADAVDAITPVPDKLKSQASLNLNNSGFSLLQLAAGNYSQYSNKLNLVKPIPGKLLASYSPKALPIVSVANPINVLPLNGENQLKNDKPLNVLGNLNDDSDINRLTLAVWYLEKDTEKEKYNTKEEDSLFEIITKAHIRNYKKIIQKP